MRGTFAFVCHSILASGAVPSELNDMLLNSVSAHLHIPATIRSHNKKPHSELRCVPDFSETALALPDWGREPAPAAHQLMRDTGRSHPSSGSAASCPECASHTERPGFSTQVQMTGGS